MFRIILTLVALTLTGRALGQPADLILTNGRIWTVDDEHPWAQALAVRKGRILAVGSNDNIAAFNGAGTRTIDLNGAFAMPAFNDNHVHFAAAAAFLEFNVMRVHTQKEFVTRVRDVVRRLDKGEWILGGYWGAYDDWAEGSSGGATHDRFTPNVRLIDGPTRDNPMFIRRFDDSEFAVNRTAMEHAGLDPDSPSAPGVEFVRDAAGRPTGIIHGERAKELFEKIAPHGFSHDRRVRQTQHALEEIARNGVTNVSDMSDDEQLDIYNELRERGELTCRIHFRYPLERWRELASRGVRVSTGDEWIRLGALKGHIDGIMGTSTARFLEPYKNDPNNRGKWRKLMYDETGALSPQHFLDLMIGADRAGLQLSVHAIGDEANHLLLDFLEKLDQVNGLKNRRFRLVHAQAIAPDDFDRLGELRVVAEVQPFHLSDDMRCMEERICHERCKGAYAFRSIKDSTATLSFGTDWPGTNAAEYPINPMLGIHAAVTRQTRTGQPPGGWFPEQRITIQEAIEAYTKGTALGNFEDDVKGSLEVGKVADIVVLSRNLIEIEPRKILDARVLRTIVGGREVYLAED